VSLAGMPPLITAQVLYGLQQRTRSGAHTRVQMLRLVVEDLRHAQADSVTTASPSGMGREKRTVLTALARHAALALSDPDSPSPAATSPPNPKCGCRTRIERPTATVARAPPRRRA
jgi:hypothetical protein